MRRGMLLIGLLVLVILGVLGYHHWKHGDMFYLFRPAITIETIICNSDLDGDGLDDQTDIVEGARLEVKNHTNYHSEKTAYRMSFIMHTIILEKRICSYLGTTEGRLLDIFVLSIRRFRSL